MRKNRDRDLEIIRARESGLTYDEIGEQFGMTKQGVQLCIKRHSDEGKHLRYRDRIRKKEQSGSISYTYRKVLEACIQNGYSFHDIAERMDMSYGNFLKKLKRDDTEWTDEEYDILEDIGA